MPTLGQECRWQRPSLLDWLAAVYRMFCSFPFLFSLLCGPVFLFCFFSPFLFPNHRPGQHKFFFFFFLFNFASRVSYRAYSLGKREKIFCFSFLHFPTHHLSMVLSASLNVIPQYRQGIEDIWSQVVCFAACCWYQASSVLGCKHNPEHISFISTPSLATLMATDLVQSTYAA